MAGTAQTNNNGQKAFLPVLGAMTSLIAVAIAAGVLPKCQDLQSKTTARIEHGAIIQQAEREHLMIHEHITTISTELKEQRKKLERQSDEIHRTQIQILKELRQ